jgi:hypothetical protein
MNEEKRESFRQKTLKAWHDYLDNGYHVSAEEDDALLAELELGNDKAGSRAQLHVLNAQQQYNMALRDLTQSRYVYLILMLKLASIVGDDSLTFVDEINAVFPSKVSRSGVRP